MVARVEGRPGEGCTRLSGFADTVIWRSQMCRVGGLGPLGWSGGCGVAGGCRPSPAWFSSAGPPPGHGFVWGWKDGHSALQRSAFYPSLVSLVFMPCWRWRGGLGCRGGSPLGGSHDAHGRGAWLRCGLAAMAVRAVWWPVLGNRGWFRSRRVCRGVIPVWLGSGRRRRRPRASSSS